MMAKAAAVFMFTNDLRISDNLTLDRARREHPVVWPVVVKNKQPNKRMQAFYEERIAALNADLGGALRVFRGLSALKQMGDFSALYYNVDPTYPPEAFFGVSKWCLSNGVQEHRGVRDHTLLDFTRLPRPYKVFSNFYDTFKNVEVLQSRAKTDCSYLSNNDFSDYENTHDFIAKPTTGLSVYLNFGCVSMRQACHAFRDNPALFRQLMWREFYAQIVYFHPQLHRGAAFYPQRDALWQTSAPEILDRWKRGRTGVPLVDASMRCLNATGLLHNRARMVAASYLVKDLGVDWRLGEAYFRSQLLDYNFASNNGGWQFISGTGASSMMQSRKFSPWLQNKKYDPECEFVKRWVPELRDADPRSIFTTT
jgi:deoxyribodipyrimidine photo-lyase